MRRLLATTCIAGTGTIIIAAASGALVAQTRPQGPIATYWATATTSTGLGADAVDPMAMLSGGGAPQRSLLLQLESTATPKGAPSAEHLPPEGLKAGPSLPLVSPRAALPNKPERSGTFSSGEMPKGRMLIYWGCGEAVRPGQPLIVDFARMKGGNMPGLPELAIQAAAGPSAGGGRTYGEWPNEKSRTRVPARGSLIGDHLVRGNYTPDIRFTLGAGQDFMGPLRLTGIADHKRGPVPLGWQPVREAKAYFAYAMGSAKGDDMIVWSSSDIAISPGTVPEVLSPGDLAGLLRRKVVLSPETSRCAIPAAVAEAAPEAMLRMIAFGGEVNISYPPKPADPRTPWKLDHVVKIRYASTASAILGMPDMSDGADAEGADDNTGSNGLGGLLRGLSRSGPGGKVRSLFKKSNAREAPDRR